MKNAMCGVSVVVALILAQAQASAQTKAPASNNGAIAAPTAVSAKPAAPVAGWYYLPNGWYLMTPAVPNATASGTAANPPVALPAGLPATSAAPVFNVMPYAPQPSNVAPWSWQHGNLNDNNWVSEHGG